MTKKLSATEIFSLSYRNDWGSVSPSPESVLTPVEDTSRLKLPQLCAKISTVSNLFFADGFKCIMWVREKIVFFSWRLTSDGSYFHVAPAFCLSPHYLQFWIVFIWICSSSSWAPPPNLNATLPLFRSIPCRFFSSSTTLVVVIGFCIQYSWRGQGGSKQWNIRICQGQARRYGRITQDDSCPLRVN